MSVNFQFYPEAAKTFDSRLLISVDRFRESSNSLITLNFRRSESCCSFTRATVKRSGYCFSRMFLRDGVGRDRCGVGLVVGGSYGGGLENLRMA